MEGVYNVRERKRRPSLLVICERDTLIKRLLVEFQRHNVAKQSIIQLLVGLISGYTTTQQDLILSGSTESLQELVGNNKELQQVVEKLEKTTYTDNNTVRNLAATEEAWEPFVKALIGN